MSEEHDYTQPPSGPPPQTNRTQPPTQTEPQTQPQTTYQTQTQTQTTYQTSSVECGADNNAIISVNFFLFFSFFFYFTFLQALAYVFGFISALIVILTQSNFYNKFHGWQALFLFLAWLPFFIIAVVLDSVLIFTFFTWICWLCWLILTILCIIFAIIWAPSGKLFKLPLLGMWAEKMASKNSAPVATA